MRLAAAAGGVALAAITCAGASERALLVPFFAAPRLRDRTAPGRFSTVVFEPRTDGIVEQFVVLSVTPERLVEQQQSSGGAGPSDERQLVTTLSLADPIDPVDQARYRTLFLEKQVTVSASIRLPD